MSKLTDAEYVLRDVAGGLEDYYLGVGEAPGVWVGRLASELNLVGVVGADDLRALVQGREPQTGGCLVGDDSKRKVRAYDVTLSAPKSVSLLWAFATAEVSSVVSIAHVEAVAAALAFLEERAGVTRQQRGGVRRRVTTSGLAIATFVHRTSREADPQLHTHCVIPNLVQRRDGSWVAIDGTPLYGWAKAAGSIYQEELRSRLSERLGVAWGPDRNGCREMLGFSETELEKFSKRTVQIADYVAEQGIVPRDDKERMQADERAALATRRRKDRSLTPARLAERWGKEAGEIGLPTGHGLERRIREAARGQRRELTTRDLGRLFEVLVDPEVGLCAKDSRFGEAQVIAQVAAFGAGQLTSEQIQRIATLFLGSDGVVRLIDRDPGGRTPPRWSTVAHRRLEDRVLANISQLRQRNELALDPVVLKDALSRHPGLGDDQCQAVRVLTGEGPALRALIAPPGHGKTTALRAAAEVAARAGRPVVALATTNQAVGELQKAGLDASTVSRFALNGSVVLAGAVVIIDELSQLPTVEADLVLSAVAGREGVQVWLVGDPLQAQPVRAGGLAHLMAELAEKDAIPSATLTVNRRQANPLERDALARYRDGEIGASQHLREEAGLEHQGMSPEATRDAMADAVIEAIARHGAREIAALAVTHADCEDLADRIRTRLAQRGELSGPALDGPGWVGRRSYQAGDRVLFHAHVTLDDGRRLTNGTTATVLAVSGAGLTVRPDGGEHNVVVPADFVTGRRSDGLPQLSHSFCRTIDGVQGGTWIEVHLLGTAAALDRYRGYVGQSRARVGTHTWNTRAPDAGDHGGRLVHSADTPSEEVAVAMQRAQPKTFAAIDDPYRISERLERERDAHRAVLAGRPPDPAQELAKATAAVAAIEREVQDARDRVAHWQRESEATSGLGRLRPGAGRRHDQAEASSRYTSQGLDHALQRLERCQQHFDQLDRQQHDRQTFDRNEGWRRQRLADIAERLDQHWADVVLAAARAGDPSAYGKHHLNQVHRTLLDRIRLNPDDRSAQRNLAEIERAVVSSPQVKSQAETAQRRQPALTRPGPWPPPGQYVHQNSPGPEPRIGL